MNVAWSWNIYIFCPPFSDPFAFFYHLQKHFVLSTIPTINFLLFAIAFFAFVTLQAFDSNKNGEKCINPICDIEWKISNLPEAIWWILFNKNICQKKKHFGSENKRDGKKWVSVSLRRLIIMQITCLLPKKVFVEKLMCTQGDRRQRRKTRLPDPLQITILIHDGSCCLSKVASIRYKFCA